MMPAFSEAMARAPITLTPSVWSRPMLVMMATVGVGHIGRVVPTEQPDFDHGDVDRDLGEPRVSAATVSNSK